MSIENVVILNILHPFFADNYFNWQKWRLTYEGGQNFINHYLKQFSKRESAEDFKLRKQISYCPSFSKAALNEIKNNIHQRLSEVTRKGGPKSYQDAISGIGKGVDRSGNSMNSYLGRRILPELLSMARVGIFVDMPQLKGPTLKDKGNDRPYLYMYRTEQIRSWTFDIQNPDILLSVLLQDYDYVIDQETGLTTGIAANFRHMWVGDDGIVNCNFYNGAGELIGKPLRLDIERIPFVILELSSSLLADVADYQIALLNLESSDLAYALKSNFPFYTEQFDPKSESVYLKQPAKEISIFESGTTNYAAAIEKVQEVRVGIAAGRKYPIGAERPQFINPSAEPLRVSMEKADQLKEDIRKLVLLSVASLEPRRASAESKKQDDKPLESGLFYIGNELEHAEKQIAFLWSMYEGEKSIPTVIYPEDYVLKSDEEKQAEADRLQKLIPEVNSQTFQKEATKRIVDLTLGRLVSVETLDDIYQEIDDAVAIHSHPDVITSDVENGLVGLETASKIRGYPPGEVEKAKQDHADRLARIAMAQTPGIGFGNAQINSPSTNNGKATLPGGPGARGVNDLATNPKDSKDEKRDTLKNPFFDMIPDPSSRGVGESD